MKNLILTILIIIIINTFLAIFALVRTYKDKFSETNGKSMNIVDIKKLKSPKPFEIEFIMNPDKHEITSKSIEVIKDKMYNHKSYHISDNKKYARHLDWIQTYVESVKLSHSYGTTVITKIDEPKNYCIFKNFYVENKSVKNNIATEFSETNTLIDKSGIFEKYNTVTYITNNTTMVRIYKFE
jgi:hypothetical protein